MCSLCLVVMFEAFWVLVIFLWGKVNTTPCDFTDNACWLSTCRSLSKLRQTGRFLTWELWGYSQKKALNLGNSHTQSNVKYTQASVCSDYYRKFLKITTLLSTYDFHGVFKGVLKFKNMWVMHFSHVLTVFWELLSINHVNCDCSKLQLTTWPSVFL